MTIVTNRMLLFFIFLIINVPNVEVEYGGSILKIYNAIFFLLLLLYIKKPQWKLHMISSYLLFIVLFFTAYLIINGRDEHLIAIANSYIPNEWQVLYGKQVFDDFYRSTTVSLFQLANFLILVFYFNFFHNVNRSLFLFDSMKYVLAISILTQISISIIQLVAFNNDRPSGSFGNAQSLGFFYLLCICYYSVFFSSWKKLTSIIVLLLAIIITGTRSALFIAIIITALNMLNISVFMRKLILFLLFISVVILCSLFSSSDVFRGVILEIIGLFTSPHSMYVRGLMWNSFYQTLTESPLFGTKGITVYFADNFFWFFILSYGICGAVFIGVFFLSIIRSANSKFVFFLGVCTIIQSVSYYGFFIENMGVILTIFLAISLNHKVKIGY
ncbi:hypothetical protein BXT93_10015 [Escherichia coli]|uniref:O-antigen polymerase n=1 Tax=Escherichia coli TaxID=562 RepID=A0A1V2GGW2_ECOLX|nr:hypothetical protein [Escherichia coli]ONG04883.1 hypothetical protein BWR13_21440 [Escherichia coli]ONG35082.1 hypothetical protein BXT93_10015 [Escherichia coli]